MTKEEINNLSNRIIGAAIEVHRYFGPGLLESTYQSAMMTELKLRNLRASKQIDIPCYYKGQKLECAYRADIIVEDTVIVELKSTVTDNPIYWKQLYTYLKLTDKRLGLLINFNKERLVDGLSRIVNNLR